MPEISVDPITQGKFKIRQHEFKMAEEQFLKALKNNPKSVEALYLLAQCQRNLYRFEEALDSARKALELDPINPEGLYELCETYRRMGNQIKALEIAKKMDALPQAKKIFDTKKLVSIIQSTIKK